MMKTSTIERRVMSKKTFDKLSRFITEQCGIRMPDAKKTMLESRINSRLRKLGFDSFEEYVDYLFSETGMKEELVPMIDIVTTNKTEFFREDFHFDFLTAQVLPEMAEKNRVGHQSRLSVWSAGCSTGQEPYTLSIVLSEFAEKFNGFDFTILGTDISTRVLETAAKGVYDIEQIRKVDQNRRKKYFLKSKNPNKKIVRVKPELRSRVALRWLNFMEDFRFREKFDVIFCRNVMIYFDLPTRQKLVSKFCKQLNPGGYLFLGHSESLSGINAPVERVSASIYKLL